jgi:hypothetical protein
MNKSYIVKYEVHCKLQNFFNKEIVIKNCISEMHAKAKLDDFCKKKHGIEYQCIIVLSCKEKYDLCGVEDIFGKGFADIFGKKYGGKK